MLEFDFGAIISAIPQIFEGIKVTLFISAISSAFALLIGIFAAYLRYLGGFANFLAASFVEFVRNVPLLIHIFFFYKGLPAIGVNFSPITCGILALSIYTGAYISEVIRSGISSINKEQVNASFSLGFSRFQTFKYIVFPQAFKIILPPLGSQFLSLVKNSSLVSFISVTDIFYVIYKAAIDDFRFIEFFIVGAGLYMSISGLVIGMVYILEKFLFKTKAQSL